MIRVIGASVLLAVLAGCAGAKVTDVASVTAASPPPFEILVDVSVTQIADNDRAKLAHDVGTKLQSDLVQRLTEARVTAEPFVPGTRHPGSIVLRVAIVDADPGSSIERTVIGFGFGRATLQAKADLVSTDTGAAYSMTAFSTSSDSGHKPGLVLPGSVALATGSVIHLAVGGALHLATDMHGGLDKPVTGTATAIVEQLRKYYASVGWHWPAGDRA